jgi:hypothetical protein
MRDEDRGVLLMKRALLVLVCGFIALEIHEISHAIVYWSGGYPAWISFQRLHHDFEVPQWFDRVAKAAGPIGTWLAAAIFYMVARKRESFFWRTMAFSNITLRIFPTGLAIARTVAESETGFSDEGDLAFALTSGIPGRLTFLVPVLLVSMVGTWWVGKSYRFKGWRNLWLIAIYALSFSVMFLAFFLDHWFGFDRD